MIPLSKKLLQFDFFKHDKIHVSNFCAISCLSDLQNVQNETDAEGLFRKITILLHPSSRNMSQMRLDCKLESKVQK